MAQDLGHASANAVPFTAVRRAGPKWFGSNPIPVTGIVEVEWLELRTVLLPLLLDPILHWRTGHLGHALLEVGPSAFEGWVDLPANGHVAERVPPIAALRRA